MNQSPRRVQLEMVDVSLMQFTNRNVKRSVVEGIVAEGIDPEKFGVLPAYFNGKRWIITDGNHRLTAAKILGVQYVPVAPLTKQEYAFIAYSKRRSVDLLVEVPDNPKYHARE